MHRARRARISLLAACALLAACGATSSGHGTSTTSVAASTSTSGGATTTTAGTTTSRASTTTQAPTTTSSPSTTTTTLLLGWTEARLLAQLIMVGGDFSDIAAAKQAVEGGAGGVVFLGLPPAGSGPSIKSGLAQLEAAAASRLLTATDEEGGQIARLQNVVGSIPWPRQMAAQMSTAGVQHLMTSQGAAMLALGVDMDLAPVLDTASGKDAIDEENLRSFSEMGSVAASYGLDFIAGLRAAGMVPVAKHFPGLGHANGNTDAGQASVPPLSQLLSHDLIPFQRAIDAGVPVVMMSNATEPDWGGMPASLNGAAYRYLRGMGFAGMIITDSLDAGAILDAGTPRHRGR